MEKEIKETIKIGTLSGWDSDNPTSTWGGLIGFIIGKSGVEEAFDRDFQINLIFIEQDKIFQTMGLF